MPSLDDLWDYDDPAASEGRFRLAFEVAEAGGDATSPPPWSRSRPPGSWLGLRARMR